MLYEKWGPWGPGVLHEDQAELETWNENAEKLQAIRAVLNALRVQASPALVLGTPVSPGQLFHHRAKDDVS